MKFTKLVAASLLAMAAVPSTAYAQAAADVGATVGAMVYGPDGSEVGKIDSISGGNIIVDTGTNKAALPANSFAKGSKGPRIGYTKQQLDDAIKQANQQSAAQLQTALTAGAETGRPIVALSAVGASGFAGAGWFKALIDQGRAEFPDVPLTAILDCADRAGDIPAALKRGITHVVFTGHAQTGEKLQDVAAQMGAVILPQRPPTCDLIDSRDPLRAARRRCETPEK